jgi:hypothetical protein
VDVALTLLSTHESTESLISAIEPTQSTHEFDEIT